MAINFTDSPADGATQVISGRTYTYNSAKNKWDTTATEVVGPTATVYATVDNLPGTATTGDQAFVSGTNRLYIWNGSGWYNIALINTTPSISGASASYDLASDGTPTVVTITASDPEELPITYSIASDTSGNIATVTQNANVFTITPSTNTAGTFSLTFRASDGVNIATAVSEFTLEFIVENSKYTNALITSVGANNAVNNSFTDSSSNSHTITANGNVTQNTFSPYRHGGYSTYFDGSGDYIRYDDASLAEGTGDFTVEFWVRRDGNQSLNDTIVGHDTTPGWQICFNSDGSTIRWMTNATDASRVLPASLNDQQWHHVVYQRDSGTLQGFLDGVSLGTVSLTTNFTNQRIEIGVNRGGTAYFTGNVRDVRIIKGAAFYSSSGFNVPIEPLTAVSGTGYSTTLLSCHLPYIADGGANSLSPIVNGNTKTEPFAPYDYGRYASDDNGGSIYFDGSGDYLSVPNDTSFNFGSGDFTVEFWTYPTTIPSGEGGLVTLYEYASDRRSWYVAFDGSKLELRLSTSGTSADTVINSATGVFKANNWYHVAMIREGNNITGYVNGVSVATGTHSGAIYSNSTDPVIVGSVGTTLGGAEYEGAITDVRIVKGTAVYTEDFTPPTAPLTAITNTSLLLSGTNAGIIDKSQTVKSLTFNGDVKSSTTETKYLSSSMYFDGTGDYITLSTPDHLDWLVNLSSVGTIEAWVYYTNPRSGGLVYAHPSILAIGSTYFTINVDSAGTLRFYWYNGTTNSFASTSAVISANTWAHVAAVITATSGSNNVTLYVNGSAVGTGTYGGLAGQVSAALGQSTAIGWGNAADSNSYWPGYISDLRITKGLARYTTNFTPPTSALKA